MRPHAIAQRNQDIVDDYLLTGETQTTLAKKHKVGVSIVRVAITQYFKNKKHGKDN